jgi:homospermidine synthase
MRPNIKGEYIMNTIEQYKALLKTVVEPFYKLSEDLMKDSHTYKDYVLSVTSRKHKIKNKRKRKK